MENCLNRKLMEWPGRDGFSDGGRISPRRTNPCGIKEEGRDADEFQFITKRRISHDKTSNR